MNNSRVLSLAVLIAVVVATNGGVLKDYMLFPRPDGNGEFLARITPSEDYKAPGDVSDIHFHLFTKANPEDSDEILVDDLDSISNSHYIDGAPLKFLIHGFTSHIGATFPWKLREQYVMDEAEDYNIILMDWSLLVAEPDYFAAVQNCQIASQHVADLLNFLVDNGKLTWDNVHLIGYSLGGQLVGQIGNRVGPETIARITSLDPALPLFDVADDVNKTSPDDAKFVDVIHTAANGFLAYYDPLGHVDFYPNGGRFQPGCGVDPTGSCSHGRAPATFTESVFASEENKFYARECPDWDAFQSGQCNENAVEELGHHVPTSARGTFFLHTKSESPYSNGMDGSLPATNI